jgi:hypothetical protein
MIGLSLLIKSPRISKAQSILSLIECSLGILILHKSIISLFICTAGTLLAIFRVTYILCLRILGIVKENRSKFENGLVHSFTGDEEELNQLLSLDLYIGVNGCSLKTPENLEIVKKIPLDKIVLETDSPYCDIRNTHAGAQYIKTKFPRCRKVNLDFNIYE